MYHNFNWTLNSRKRNRLTREYEPLQPYLLYALAEFSQCQSFLDIGANIGVYSFFFSNLSTIEKIYTFEPNPKAAREIEHILKINNVSADLSIQNLALSDSEGYTNFNIIGELSGANGIARSSIQDKQKTKRNLKVKTSTLDQFFREGICGSIGLKIDVEGHEYAVIQGGKNFLKKNATLIQIEAYDYKNSRAIKELVDLGYEVLTSIGPDYYVTNIDYLKKSEIILSAFKRASEFLVESSHADINESIFLDIIPNLTLTASGTSVKTIKKFKKAIFSKIS